MPKILQPTAHSPPQAASFIIACVVATLATAGFNRAHMRHHEASLSLASMALVTCHSCIAMPHFLQHTRRIPDSANIPLQKDG